MKKRTASNEADFKNCVGIPALTVTTAPKNRRKFSERVQDERGACALIRRRARGRTQCGDPGLADERRGDMLRDADKEKKVILFREAAPIAKRQIPGYQVFLFQLPDFYVEIHCSVENKEIKEFMMFQDSEYLTPYLNAIQINNIFK